MYAKTHMGQKKDGYYEEEKTEPFVHDIYPGHFDPYNDDLDFFLLQRFVSLLL